MQRRTVVVGSRAYGFAADAVPPVAERYWSLVQGRAIDELTGDGLTVAPWVQVAEPQIDTRTGEGGIFILMARPRRRVPPLPASGVTLHFTLGADGYLAVAHSVTLPTYERTLAPPAPAVGAQVIDLSSNAGLSAGQLLLFGPVGPNQEQRSVAQLGPGPHQVRLSAPLAQAHAVGDPVAAAPLTLPDLPLHRAPVRIRGRAVRRSTVATAATSPVANAVIQVQGIWRTQADLRKHLPAVPATLVSLAPGLYAARDIGATLAAQDLPVVPGEDKLLLAEAPAGSTRIRLSDRRNLAAPPALPPFSVLRIDADHPEAAEYLRILALDPDGAADEPATVTLAAPLRLAHRALVRVQRVQPKPAGAAKVLAVAASAGDTCVFLKSSGGLAGAATVHIAGGVVSDEYQQVRTFTAISDADGYFALPPLSRVAQIHIHASAAALSAVELDVQPDYGQPDNRLDLVFS